MCGIAGVTNYNNEDLSPLINSQLHRGPDAQNFLVKDRVALLHNRLSIQDIQGGVQPLDIDGYTIIFNGEIYNHQSLRREFLSKESFKTNSDTETLLKLYIKYREKVLNFLDGMFAFTIYDPYENRLFFARDRAGKKPLYYIQKRNQFIFASEINPIKNFCKLETDEEAIKEYLRVGFFTASQSVYKDLKNFPKGSFAYLDLNTHNFTIKPYFQIEEFYKTEKMTLNQAIDGVECRLKTAIKNRLESSDLEVGAFLSGGIDSSLIVAMASEYKKDLKTFTVSFQGAYNEAPLAELTAKKYGTQHKTIEIGLDLKNDIEKILHNYGQPFWDSSAIPSWYVSREAKKDVTVILNGDGADEIFGGYRRYVAIKNSWDRLFAPLSPLLKVLPKANNKKSLYNFAYRLLELSSKSDTLEKYLSTTTDLQEGFTEFFSQPKEFQILDSLRKTENLDATPLQKILINDFNNILYSDLLVKMDIATMAHSLEGRSPFLGKELLEFAPKIPDSYKISGTKTKFLLRELSKKYLPAELINQPKRGFEVPLKDWVNHDLKEVIFDYLSEECYASKFVDKKFLIDLKNNSVQISQEKRAKILWALFAVQSWYKNSFS